MVQWDLTRFGPVRYFQVNRPVHRESWLEQGCGCDFKCSWCSLGEKSHLGGNLETSLIDFVQSQNHKHHGRNHSRIQILLAGVDLPHWSPMWIRFSHPRCKTLRFCLLSMQCGCPTDVPKQKVVIKFTRPLLFLGEIQVCKWIPANQLIRFAVVIGSQTYISTDAGCFPSTIDELDVAKSLYSTYMMVLSTGIDVARYNWGCWLCGCLIMFIHHLLLPSWPFQGLQRKTNE